MKNSNLFKNLQDISLYCIDLGSRAGLPKHWQKCVKSLNIDAFDPDVEAEDKGYKRLKNVNWYSYGLAKKTGKFNFYLTSTPSGSSLYKPNSKIMSKYSPQRYWKVQSIEKLNFLSLEDFLKKFKKPSPDLIKLDTQGSELDILKSLSKKNLNNVLGIEIEVEFIEMYKNQPLFGEINSFLSKNNFEILDLRTHRSYRLSDEVRGGLLKKYFNLNSYPSSFSAKLIAGDAIYIKKYDNLMNYNKNQILKILKILTIYNFFDEAIALIKESYEKNKFNNEEKDILISDIKMMLPQVSFLYKQNNIFRKFVTLFKMLLNIFISQNNAKNTIAWTMRKWPDQ